MGHDSREAFYRSYYCKRDRCFDPGSNVRYRYRFLDAGDLDARIAETAGKLNGILDRIREMPFADRVAVFGSTARGRFLPGDIDLAIDLREGDPIDARDLSALIKLARANYGWVDPFLIKSDGKLIVRNDTATGWDAAKHARSIMKSIREEGRPLAEVRVSPDPTPVAYDPVAWEVEGSRKGWASLTERGWQPDVVLHWQRDLLKDTAEHPFPEVRALFEEFAESVPGHVSLGIEVEAATVPRM